MLPGRVIPQPHAYGLVSEAARPPCLLGSEGKRRRVGSQGPGEGQKSQKSQG